MNHAFFKALLFLSAGCIIHALSDEQDMRKMGGLARLLPYTYGMIIIGSLALTGLPFLTGFYSKDVILESAYAKYTMSGSFVFWLGNITVFFTSYYSFRLLFLGFLGPVNMYKSSAAKIHDAPLILGLPLAPLAFGSIFVGYLLKEAMIGIGSSFWSNALLTLPQNALIIESEFIPQEIKYVPLLLTFAGGVVAFLVNIVYSQVAYEFKQTRLGRTLYIFFNKRWFFDKVYNDFVSTFFLHFGYHYSFKLLDKGIIEIIGPFGIAKSIKVLIKELQRLQTGFVYHYALVMLIGLIFLISLLSISSWISFWVDARLYVIFIFQFLFFSIF